MTREVIIDKLAEWWFNKTIGAEGYDITWKNSSAAVRNEWRSKIEVFLAQNEKWLELKQ